MIVIQIWIYNLLGLQKRTSMKKKKKKSFHLILSPFQLSLVTTCLSAAEKEKEIFKTDLQNLGLSKERMIKSAWNTRSDSQSDVIFLTDKEILFFRDKFHFITRVV